MSVSNNKSKKNTTSPVVNFFWRLTWIGFAAFLAILLLANYGVLGKMPSIEELENPTASLASQIYASDGTLMGKYYLEDRTNIEFKEISPNIVNALIATEDERFYDHSGIDGKSLARAVFGVVTFNPRGGGSTITQQLALNLFSERAKNPVSRALQKLKEWIIAVKLERNFTKDEILALYLNTVAFGDNLFGIKNASRTFFQKDPASLSVDEAAVLIGMLKGNTIYNPRRNPKAALDRRNTVMDQMVRNDFITKSEAAILSKKPISLNYKKLDQNTGLSPYFREILREDMKKWCKEHKKPNGDNYNIYKDGLRIYTTINPRMQIYAEEAVATHMSYLQKLLNNQSNIKTGSVWKGKENILDAAMKVSDRWKNLKEEGLSDNDIKANFQKKVNMKVFAWNPNRETDTTMTPLDSIKYHRQMLQTGFLVADPMTGEVKAWVGGINFKTFKYDHVNKNTKRQVGSTIKPLLYVQAIKDAGFSPETPCDNSPQCFPAYNNWCSKNYSGKGGGTVTMASGLGYSLNNVSAYLIKQIGPKRFADWLKECKIESDIPVVPSLALGTPDISLYEMVRAYTMFPGGGFNVKPYYISRIEDKNGNVLQTFATERDELISETDAYIMCKMMQGVMDFGTGRRMRNFFGIHSEMGGKTGTTNDNADAWFLGFTPQLLTGTWVGCDDRFIRFGSSLGEGSASALPVAGYFLQKVFADKSLGIEKEAKFIKPVDPGNDLFYDYRDMMNVVPPGAEGENHNSNEYGDIKVPQKGEYNIGPESKIITEEQEILKKALEKKAGGNEKDDKTPEKSPANTPNPEERTPKAVMKKGTGG